MVTHAFFKVVHHDNGKSWKRVVKMSGKPGKLCNFHNNKNSGNDILLSKIHKIY